MSAAGLAQAERLARRFWSDGIEAVYTSPLERTRQTAEPIAAACGLELIEEAALVEIDFGDWNGRSFAELDADPDWRRWNGDRDQARPPGGETMLEVQQRLGRFLETLARSGHGAVVAVSHADVIKSAVALALGLPLRAHDRFEIAPASVTTLRVETWGFRLISLNGECHD